ncbi:Asp-tRNA(Asn)/Glu-tRNA(Gln) amidotransferase GatCAB subunit C [Candidatus Kuenenbacteria bacterium CG11_big_fil_rev_8_21_14_0_20_37_9]|uniref:Aspartyl/glutamyl-tRNA(Asn/Gln) amidotransferase subunit C n=2 Tax=Candidatus Kueneniibacteriota TaxID=1752740 RepID=A0A2M6XRW2_9BACT|nr:MAG: asparaginyl/glutamyl-tRNA amidotransferase subunit C [Candidatus Kuenenbacteria bacterium CG1_02_38_13]PIR05442.1 MAG: Asp-tRNA(Asn)/Glu-tRNA(Gln) amidotransferase GatCAB subunit C [Candidatus Kuenenbacteria bacterium CG11_big_fil_rev_8_21_14_0_20_37_9]PIU10385.1 MAG: Asp-tRNA(Asn)/Glu-tRNA(Gln) amidotransferase GatCAB subunit C [Candidatus Kuenenbacteria bacterium CG08_land_8_20_14_0_20_37_23]
MLFDVKQIEHIAGLARLALSAEEKKKFAEQLSSVLDYFEKLKDIDTKNVETVSQSIELNNIYRQDEVKNCDENTHRKILDNAPEKDGDYFKVDKIL